MKLRNLVAVTVLAGVGVALGACAQSRGSSASSHPEEHDTFVAVHGAGARVVDQRVDCKRAPCGDHG